jgi:small conductance mechanosensitive channel
MENITEFIYEQGSAYGMKILAALAILIMGRLIVKIATGWIRRGVVRAGMDETLARFLVALTKTVLLTLVVVAAISALGVEPVSFVAVLGAAGLAIGLALQGSLSNFAAGVMLIIFRPFKVGDYVEAGGSAGSIQEINIFNTILHTPDNKVVILPNSTITGGSITNYSTNDTRRVDMVFGIGYDDDLRIAKQILEEIVTSDERVLKDPAPTVALSELADSSVNFVVRPWVKSADYWGVYFDVHEKVKLTFDEKGISIPYPQTDVHLHQTASGKE